MRIGGYKRYHRNLGFFQVVLVIFPPGTCTPAHDHNLPVRGICLWGTLLEYVQTERKPFFDLHLLECFTRFKESPGAVHQVANRSPKSGALLDFYPRGDLAMKTYPPLIEDLAVS